MPVRPLAVVHSSASSAARVGAAVAPASRSRISRRQRLVRGWVLASIGVLGGSFSHALAAGHAPSGLVVLLCWALAGLACTGLAGIRLRAVPTAAGLLLAQGLLHVVLSLSGAAEVAPAAGTMTTMGHAAHWGHASLAVHAADAACAPSGGMTLLHLMTALLTLAAVLRGETALEALRDVARTVLHTVAVLVSGFRPALPGSSGPMPARSRRARPDSLDHPGPAALRGPPAAAHFA